MAKSFIHYFAINLRTLTKEQRILVNLELFKHVCEGLMEKIREQNRDYFELIKLKPEKEKNMIEANFIKHIINDILSTEEYTLSGIAYYTNTPEEILFDIVIGRNTNPSLSLSLKIIELHHSVRPSLYSDIVKKMLQNLSDAA